MASLPPIPEGFSLTSELPPIPEGFELADAPATNIDLKSKKARAQYQLERLQNNPDFQAMPKSEQNRLLATQSLNVRRGEGADAPISSALKEGGRFGVETGLMFANALGRGLKSAASLVQGGGEAIRQGDLGAGLSTYEEKMKEFKPLESPFGQSRINAEIGGVLTPIAAGVDEFTGQEGLSQNIMDLLALGGLKGSKLAKVSGADVVRGVKEVTPKIAAKVSEVTPWSKSQSPAGSASKQVIRADDFKQRKMEAHKPKVVENQFQNAADAMERPDMVEADPTVRAKKTENLKQGIDELEQQAAEGRIFEHDAKGAPLETPYEVGKGGVVNAYMPIKQALKNLWEGEVLPLLEKSKAGGASASMDAVAGALIAKAEQLGGKLGNALKTRAADLQGTVLDPVQLQGRITALNETLFGKGEILPIEDTIQRNALRQELGMLNEILDGIVDTGAMELGVRGLKERWAGTRQLFDKVANGVETKLRKGKGAENPTMGEGVVAAGAATSGTIGRITGFNKAKGMYQQWKNNPDTAFETMIRARRAQGNTQRPVYNPGAEPNTMPQNLTTLDPSTGVQIPARGLGAQGPTSPMTQPGPQIQTTQGPTSPMTQPGPQIQTTQGPTSPIQGGGPSPVLQADLGFTEPTTQKAPNKVEAKKAEVQALKNRLSEVENQLKAGLKETGKSGKAAVDALAMQLGVSAALITTYLLTKDEKKRQALLAEFQK